MKQLDVWEIRSNILTIIEATISSDMEEVVGAQVDRLTPQFMVELRTRVCNHKYRELPPHKKEKLEAEIKLLMHAQRDCHRNRGKDATKIYGFGPLDTYYCDCIGIMRCLEIFGFGQFAAMNAMPSDPPNLAAWMWRLQEEVMEEEGYHGDNRCEWCLDKYGKDDKSIREKCALDA